MLVTVYVSLTCFEVGGGGNFLSGKKKAIFGRILGGFGGLKGGFCLCSIAKMATVRFPLSAPA